MFRAICLPAPVSAPDGRMPFRAREPRPFSQSRTTCRIPGASSRLGRDLAFRVRNSPRSPFGCEILRVRAQRPCLGEIGRNKVLAWERARNAQAVYLRLCRASRLSKRALFSQGGTMLKSRNVSPAERPPFSQARTMYRMVSTNVPAWEGCGLLEGTYPAPAHGVPAWEKKLGTKFRLRRTSKMRGQSTCGLVVPASSANLLFSPNAGRCVGSAVIIG